MRNSTKDDLKYITNQRFLVEIKDKLTGKLFYTKRIKKEKEAFSVRDEYDCLKSMSAKVCDTKTGEMY